MTKAIRHITGWVASACLCFGITLAQAAVPATLNYQGFLTNPSTGAPLNTAGTPLNITINLWDDVTAGNLIYSEFRAVTVTNGIFNFQIGGAGGMQAPTFASVAFDKPYWLEITVGTETLTPRQPLASSAYAQRSLNGTNAILGDNSLSIGVSALASNKASAVPICQNPFPTTCPTAGVFAGSLSSQNVAVGDHALFLNDYGAGNTAVGYQALYSNVGLSSFPGFSTSSMPGSFNTAVGDYALHNNVYGNRNVAVGMGALAAATGAAANTAIGYSAGILLTGGGGNVLIGSGAGGVFTTEGNNIDIGNPGRAGESGIIRIGDGGAIQTATYLSGAVYGTSFNSTSDRNAKQNFKAIDALEILDKVAALPISRWNFKTDVATAHLGPMAQDFYAAFQVGPDDTHIATVDESGVALAAIQGLYQTLMAKDREIARIKKKASVLERELAAIKTKLGLQ
jgi:hypothetical protein